MITQLSRNALFIAGRWVCDGGRATGSLVDPSTGGEIGTVTHATDGDVDESLAAAHAAFPAWRRTPGIVRGALLRRVGEQLRNDAEDIAVLITGQLGKPLPDSRSEVLRAAELFEFAAEEARRLDGRVIPAREPRVRQWAIPEPIGPVAGFSGWNAPLITPSRKISSALAAGCTIVLKASEEVPGPAIHLVRVLQECGLPTGTVNLLFGDPARISGRLLGSPLIRGVSFTGATAVGRRVAEAAAANFKTAILELGGHAPAIVCADADPGRAAATLLEAKLRNAGQTCISPTRFLVHESIEAAFSTQLASLAREWRLGSGFDPGVQMGPLANARRLDAMIRMVSDARAKGGEVLAGGARVGTKGFFFAPTVIRAYDVTWEAANIEPFGPLAIVRPFSRLEEAVAEANRLPFGLAAYLFSRDTATVARVVDELESGVVCVNRCVPSLPETPFGGFGDSGMGKEGGVEGIRAFTRLKYVAEHPEA